jgi:hypothetical protein
MCFFCSPIKNPLGHHGLGWRLSSCKIRRVEQHCSGLTKSSLSLDIYLTFVVLTSAAIQNYKSNGNIFRQAVTDIQIE